MGEDSVTPFLGYEGKWVILLALTSNKGSHDFQLIEDKTASDFSSMSSQHRKNGQALKR